MAQVLLFKRADTSIPASFRNLTVVDGATVKTVQPAVQVSNPFELSPASWARLAALTREAVIRIGKAQAIAGSGPFNLIELRNAWNAFAAQAVHWEGEVKPALKILADGIVSYANQDAPTLYGRLEAMLQTLSDRAPTQQEADACAAILKDLASAARKRADQAGQLAAQVGPFAAVVREFANVFGRQERNPAVRLGLPDIPFMCLQYNDGLWACAGDTRVNDRRQLWTVEQQGGAFVFVSAADPSLVLMADWNEQLAHMPPFFAIPQMPRPRVAPRGQQPPEATWFVVDGDGDRCYVRSYYYPSYTLDCAGNDGWQQGTDVLNFRKNGGRNQHWAFSPMPRSNAEIGFYDVIAPVGGLAQGVGELQHLQGDWAAVADDMESGVARVLECVQLNEPFVASLQVDEVLGAWKGLADEARAASAGLG